MKVAVVGCGNISRLHFAALAENEATTLVAAVDVKPERARNYAEKYGIRAYTDFEEMLAAEQPDAVHLCLPHYLHAPYAITALEKGIHVFCEKPCSVTADETKALQKAQQSSPAQYGVCFQNRYNACIRKLMAVKQSGELGALKSVRAFVTWERGASYYGDDWHGTLAKECGCLLINQCIHTLDIMQLLGDGCESLTAHVFNDHLQGVIEGEDTATVRFRMNNGAVAVFYGTTGHGSNAPVLIEAAFEKGTLRTEGERLFRVDGDGSLCEIPLTQGEAMGKSYWGSGHPAIIKDFYDCIAANRPFGVDAVSGGKAADIVFACYRSSASGETVTL